MASVLLAKPFVASPTLQSARKSTRTQAAARTTWLPDISPPKHLKGQLPGDFGFDPLGLGVQEDRLAWYVEAEKTNGRWAMIAVAGILGQELLGVQPAWFNAGAKDYGISNQALLPIEFLVFGAIETIRYENWNGKNDVKVFPLDPLNQNSDANQLKEIKNGRLAMVAFVGFAVQALVTRQGPIEALTSHLSNPFSNNIIGSIGNLPSVIH